MSSCRRSSADVKRIFLVPEKRSIVEADKTSKRKYFPIFQSGRLFNLSRHTECVLHDEAEAREKLKWN